MILITTPVANFEMHKVSNVNMSIGNQIAMGQRYALREPSWRVEVYNDAGVLAFGSGAKGIVPAVWSHTPFTWGMNPEAIQAKFEERASNVLSDPDVPLNLRKFSPYAEGHGYKDNRYVNEYIRTAWMMYVDLSIEHYNTA